MLTSSLLVISQLARTATSKHQIERLVQSGIAALLPPLLQHPTSPGVRARACNLLGNLCRYSDAMYTSIDELDILPPLIKLCKDEDRSTRKFACFAIGNAGFHSDALYRGLESAVPLLVNLLEDEEDRTRANAAGALGNLVRNSSLLVPAMLEANAVEALLKIVQSGLHGTREQCNSTQIALFSLGNLAAHKECLAAFEALKVPQIMMDVEESVKDPTTLKYAGRVFSKMHNHSKRNKGTTVQQTPMRDQDSHERSDIGQL